MQHRQIETGAVPGHQRGHVFFDAVVEAADKLGFVGRELAERPNADAVGASQHRRDRNHAVQVMAQEIRIAGLFAAFMEHHLRDVLIRQVPKLIQPTAGVHVRYGFDIKDENVHRHFGNTLVER